MQLSPRLSCAFSAAPTEQIDQPVLGLRHALALWLYDVAWCLIAMAWSGWLLHGRAGAAVVRQRLGWLPRRPTTASHAVWIHAVSVGEMRSAAPLLALLRQRHPDWWLVMTVGNRQTLDAARALPPGADVVCWQPWDQRWCVAKALARARPDVLILVECELWPNLIARSVQRGVRVLMMNARIYERDFARYRRARWLFAPLLQSMTYIGTACAAERARLLALGAAPATTTVCGNTKFDAELPVEQHASVLAMRAALGGAGLCWILASTHADEEDQILSRCGPLRALFPTLQLVIAPRDSARAPAIAAVARRYGFHTALWSSWRTSAGARARPDVVIVDTIGELPLLLGLADLVFVGGSLVASGGHNPIEAALHGRALLLGPSQHHFRAIVAAFASAGAAAIVDNAADLVQRAAELLGDPARRCTLGERARAVVERHRGASATMLEALEAAVHVQ